MCELPLCVKKHRPNQPLTTVVDVANGKPSRSKSIRTFFRMLGRCADDTSLLLCQPATRRTLQIRVHLKAMGVRRHDRATQERQASEWNQYGRTIGAIVAEFVPEDGEVEPTPDEETDASQPEDEPGMNDPQKILAILHGLLRGFSDIVVPDMAPQIEDANCVVSQLFAAVKNFKKKTLIGTGQALEELALGLECLQKVLHSAGAVREDIDALKKAILQLRHPEAFVFSAVENAGASLVLNGEEIGGHVEAAVTNFKAEHWTEFGSELGEVVGLLAKPVSKPMPWPFNMCCPANTKVAKRPSSA